MPNRVLVVSALAVVLALAGSSEPSAQGTETPEPGLRYAVTGVASDDQLNVRVLPGADTDQVGALPPDGRDIVVTGARQDIGGSIWWQLVYPPAARGSGWVNARFLTLDPSRQDQEDADYPLRCGGTEPFWGLEIASDRARFSPFGESERTFEASPWIKARGIRPGRQFVVRLRGAGDEGFIAVLRDRNFCSDGMSDTDYPFQATFMGVDGAVLAGCCSRGGR